jgi:hypothetical protein
MIVNRENSILTFLTLFIVYIYNYMYVYKTKTEKSSHVLRLPFVNKIQKPETNYWCLGSFIHEKSPSFSDIHSSMSHNMTIKCLPLFPSILDVSNFLSVESDLFLSHHAYINLRMTQFVLTKIGTNPFFLFAF